MEGIHKFENRGSCSWLLVEAVSWCHLSGPSVGAVSWSCLSGLFIRAAFCGRWSGLSIRVVGCGPSVRPVCQLGQWLGLLVGLLVVADGQSCQSGSGPLTAVGWSIVWCYWSVMLLRLLVRLLVWGGRSGEVGQGRWLGRWSGCWFCCWLGRWLVIGRAIFGPLFGRLVGPLVGPVVGGRLLLPLVRAVGEGH